MLMFPERIRVHHGRKQGRSSLAWQQEPKPRVPSQHKQETQIKLEMA